MKIKVSNAMLNCLLAFMAAGIIFMEKFSPSLKIFWAACVILIVSGIILMWRKNFSVTVKVIFTIIFFFIPGTSAE